MTQNNPSKVSSVGVLLASGAALTIGGVWLAAWFFGVAARWSATGMITMKTNTGAGLVLAGASLLLLGVRRPEGIRRTVGTVLAGCVFLLGALTLSEHWSGFDLGIDQWLAKEAPGAAATTSPNRMGVLGAASLTLVGAGLFSLRWKRRAAPVFGVVLALMSLVPLVGILYRVDEFYRLKALTAIAWPTAVALLALGGGLVLAVEESGPLALARRTDEGARLFRQWLPLVVLVPMAVGFLSVRGQRGRLYDAEFAAGLLVLSLVVIFTALLWQSAARLSLRERLEREAKEELWELSQRLNYHVNHSPLAVIEWGPDMRLRRWAGAAERLFGWKAEEVLGKRMEDFRWIHEADQGTVAEVSASLENGSNRRLSSSNRNYRKDGSVVYCEWYNSSLVDENGKLESILSLVLDVTERREAQEVLRRGKEELEVLVAERTAKLHELVGELEHFSYTITHDMRAPLRAMRGFAEAVNELCSECPGEEQRMFLERIIRSAERMDALITDALSYSKAIRQELPLTPVDVERLLRGMVDSYPEFQSSAAEIQLEGALPLVMGNEAGLTQCFSNLLGNAVKFVAPGTRARVRVWSENRAGWVRIWVEDNGVGIPKTMQPRVFEMFSRGQTGQPGTGIGLALVRKVVDRMGGRVGVESELARGSRFWVELKPGEVRIGRAGKAELASRAA